MTDEEAIRNVISTWLEATKTGNIAKLLELITDDAVFLSPGQIPMDKASFAASFKLMIEKVTIDSSSNIQELIVSGNLAYCWNYLSVVVTPKNHNPTIRRSGYTLTIFRKEETWKLARDANMLTIETS